MKQSVDEPDRELNVVPFENADPVFDALACETARDIVSILLDEPATPSEIAEGANTSVQNATYHLDQLADADLVEVIDSWYSAKGVEMDVYAPADPIAVCFGNPEDDRVPSDPDRLGTESDMALARSD